MKIGRYNIIKEIGRGAMGIVYQAHDPNLDLIIALKVLRQDRIVSSSFVSRFKMEAKALGRLDHPNIIRVFNVDEDEGNIYIAMEFIEGESLSEVMTKKSFSMEEIIDMGMSVASALDYVHKQGIIHRDIKPSNILIKSDGRVKLTDFGIAHVEDSTMTFQNEILGTAAYMSPEQVLSKKIDGRTDIFSLGILLYEICTGKVPFQGDSLKGIFDEITDKNPASPSSVNPSVPKDLSKVISKCLKKDPGGRYESGAALVDALKRCKEVKKPPQPVKSRNIYYLTGAVIIILTIIVVKITINKVSETGQKKLIANTAALEIRSTPSSATVLIDGEVKGSTPVNLVLPADEHDINVRLKNYHDWQAKIRLNKGSETPLMIRLVPLL